MNSDRKWVRKLLTAIARQHNFLLRQTGTNIKLKRIRSTFRGGRKLAKQSRGYTPEQAEAIASKPVRLALAWQLELHMQDCVRMNC